MPSIVVPLNTAINGMASLLGITPVSSKYFARLLREDGNLLWPEIGRGRRSGTVRVRDVVNLGMAIALSEGQPSDCLRALREFRLLCVVRAVETTKIENPLTRTLNTFTRLFQINEGSGFNLPRNLADQFEWLIEQLALEIMNNRSAGGGGDKSNWPEFCITLGSGSSPMTATATYLSEKKGGDRTIVDEYSSQVSELPGLHLPYLRLNKITRTQVLIGRDELLTLAKFIAEVGKIEMNSDSPTAPGSVGKGNSTPETKKPAGTGIHGGLQNERPAPKAQTAAVHKAQSATRKGRKQSLQPPNVVSGAGQGSTLDRKGVKKWVSRSASPKAPVACSDMFEKLTA